MRYGCILLLSLTVGCSYGRVARGQATIELTPSAAEFGLGDEITVDIVNRGHESVVKHLCGTAIERRNEAGEWRPVGTPTCRSRPYVTVSLTAGQERLFRVSSATDRESGTYRVHFDLRGDDGALLPLHERATSPFTVR